MNTSILHYTVIIQKEHEHYVAHVPTLGISDFGTSVDKTKKNVKQAIACHIEGLVKSGSEVPLPDSADFYISQAELPIPKNLRFAIS